MSVNKLLESEEKYKEFVKTLPEDMADWEDGWFWEAMKFAERWRCETKKYYERVLSSAKKKGRDVLKQVMRQLIQTDLFFLEVYVLKLNYVDCNWGFLRCREVEENPNGNLDLWARGHMKTTIITFGKTIQDYFIDSNETVCLFSCTRPLAKKPLNFIKREFETNEDLKWLFDDVLWWDPKNEAPKWSEDSGLILKRTRNAKEASLEAWGLIESIPTGPHFSKLIYDDVVSPQLVNNVDILKVVVDRWEMSLNLGLPNAEQRYIGTRYALDDAYDTIIQRGAATPRVYPARLGGRESAPLVFFTEPIWKKWVTGMSPKTVAAQMYQNPKAGSSYGINSNLVESHRWPGDDLTGLNPYIIVDPAGSKKRGRDFSVFFVIGMGATGHIYIIDGEKGRYDFTERKRILFDMVFKYKPLAVFYECFGKDSEVDSIIEDMERRKASFVIEKLNDNTPKHERIEAFADMCEAGRVWWPVRIMKKDPETGEIYDLMKKVLDDEVYKWPNITKEDALDCLANITRPLPKAMMIAPTLQITYPKRVADFDPREDSFSEEIWG